MSDTVRERIHLNLTTFDFDGSIEEVVKRLMDTRDFANLRGYSNVSMEVAADVDYDGPHIEVSFYGDRPKTDDDIKKEADANDAKIRVLQNQLKYIKEQLKKEEVT